MKQYLLKRILYLVVVLFGVTFLTYIVTTEAGGVTMPAVMSRDAPLFLRYFTWLRVVVFGQTEGVFWPRQAVLSEMGRRMPGTFRLVGMSLVAIISVSVPLGVFSATKKDSPFDYAVRFFSFAGASIPNYLISYVLMIVFALRLQWFPIYGDSSPRSLVLPMFSLALPLISRYVRQIRAAILEELRQDYVTGARARGVKQWRIVLFHIMPNIMSSVLTYLGISIGHLLSGIAIIETIFVLRGVGSIAVGSIRARDYPVIQAYVLWMAFIYIFAGFVLDTILHFTDPRFRREEALH